MSAVAPAVLAAGMAAGATLVAAAALRPVAGAVTRRRAHRDARAHGDPSERATTTTGPGSDATAASAATDPSRTGAVSSDGARPRRRSVRRVGERADAVLRASLADADLPLDPGTVARTWGAAVVVAVVVAVLRWGPPMAVAAVALAAGGPIALLSWRRGRAVQRLSGALPGVLEAVAGRLRAGASLPEAMAGAADEPSGSALLDADLHDLRRRVGQGQPFAEAVEGWAERRSAPGVALVAAALVLGAEAGGARARAIDGVAATLRDRRAVAAEVDALATQARASALVMMGAPVAFAALGLLSDPEVARFLLATPAGLACLVVGLGLDAMAGWWMVGIARSAR